MIFCLWKKNIHQHAFMWTKHWKNSKKDLLTFRLKNKYVNTYHKIFIVCFCFMKNYLTAREIKTIYKISQQTVDVILVKHKIDTFKTKKWICINLKDFHKAYTSSYNPSLFNYTEKKISNTHNFLIFADIENSFLNIFSKPYKLINKNIVK